MDLKIILMIAILLGVIIYLYREISKLNHTISTEFSDMKNIIRESNGIFKKQLQIQFDNNLEKIKLINTESIQQVRKMNLIHSEPIKKSSNYYTENDSDCELGPGIKYLSDSTYDAKHNDKKCDFYPYMSQDDKMSKTSDIKTISKNTSGINISTVPMEEIKNFNNCFDPMEPTKLTPLHEQKCLDISCRPIINNQNQLKKLNLSNLSNLSMKPIDQMIFILNRDENINDDDNEIYIDEDEYDNESKNKSIYDEKSNNKIDKKSSEKINNLSIDDNDDDNNDDNNYDECSSSEIEVELEHENNLENEDDQIIEINTKKLLKEINNEDILEQKMKNDKKVKKIEKIEKIDDEASKYDSITVGSKKDKKETIIKLRKNNDESDDEDINSENDESSVVTTELGDINKNNFKKATEYKLESLKKLAKYHKIPLSTKENGKYKVYNKSDLYNKIKEILQNK